MNALECDQVMELINESGLRKNVCGFEKCYEKLVEEFIVNISEDCGSHLSKEFRQVFVRGRCVEFSPEVINIFLGRSEEACTEVELTDDQTCQEFTAQQVKKSPIKGNLLYSKLSIKYALFEVANWVPTNHTSIIANGLGKFIYVIDTNTKFDFGSYVFEQTMKHANTFAVKMLIAFPSLICGIILNQHPRILVSDDVASKRESPLSLHYKPFTWKHVPDIVMTSGKEIASTTSKEGIVEELKAISKILEETIRISTKKKIIVDKMILVLSAKYSELDEDEGVAEENGGAASNNDEEVA